MMFPENTGVFSPQQQPVWTEKWRWRLRVDRIGVDPRAGVNRAGIPKVIWPGAVRSIKCVKCGATAAAGGNTGPWKGMLGVYGNPEGRKVG